MSKASEKNAKKSGDQPIDFLETGFKFNKNCAGLHVSKVLFVQFDQS
jgi:hypothetical protein